MFRFVTIFLFALSLAGLITCQKEFAPSEPDDNVVKPLFDSIPSIANLTPLISETSGIADSKINAGHIWAMEDGGNPTQLYLVNHNGTVQKEFTSRILLTAIGRRWH